MKKKWYKLAYRSLSALMALLGFQACDPSGGEVEYGAPMVDYHVIGQVEDADGNPIAGIQVKTGGHLNLYSSGAEDAVYTDQDGRFKTPTVRSMFIGDGLYVAFEDVDGDKNGGKFANDTVWLDGMTKKKVQKGDGHWYDGAYELTADKQLKK